MTSKHTALSYCLTTLAGVLFCLLCPRDGAAQEHCNALLSEGMKNIRRTVSIEEWDNYVFHSACRKTEGGWKFDLGLAKFKLNLGSSNGEQFCEERAKKDQGRVGEATYTSLITEEALKAWNMCQTLASRNVKMETEIGVRQVNIRVQRTSGAPLMLQTVYFDKGISGCSVTHGKRGSSTTSGRELNLTLGDDRVSTIHCLRTSNGGDGGIEYFPATELSIVTDRGSLLLQLPEEERYPPSLASEINARIDSLRLETTAEFESTKEELAQRWDQDLRQAVMTPESKCRTTDWINEWDGEMNARCNSNEILVGLYSVHSNKKEDRIFKLRCCALR